MTESKHALEAWVGCLSLSPVTKETILSCADCLGDLEQANNDDLDAVASGWAPEEKALFLGAVSSLSHCGARMRELEEKVRELEEKVVTVRQEEREDAAVTTTHLRKKLDDARAHQLQTSNLVTKQDLVALKNDVVGSCIAQIKDIFDHRETNNIPVVDAAPIVDTQRPKKRRQPSSGGTKKPRTTLPPAPRTRKIKTSGVGSDAAWAKGRSECSFYLPMTRPDGVFYHNKWKYQDPASGEFKSYDSIDAVYEAAVKHQGPLKHQGPPDPRGPHDDDEQDDDSSSSSPGMGLFMSITHASKS